MGVERLPGHSVHDNGLSDAEDFKANATAKATRHGKYHSRRNIDEWMGEYHIISVVESVFSSIKRCFGPDIKSIKGWLKRRELAIKVLAYNIKRTSIVSIPKTPDKIHFRFYLRNLT